MSSIALTVFKATIGLLVNKARDKAAEKLTDGDVTDQMFRAIIVREIDDIKSKLDGISRKDLLSSISFFEEGIEILYQVFDKVMSRSELAWSAIPGDNERPSNSASTEPTLQLAKAGVATMELDESDLRMLFNAKDRFKDARRKATEAFNNESLDIRERILAMQYRLMATLLEAIDNPNDAFPICKVCMKELHALPEVQKNVKVQIEKAFVSKFGKDVRLEIISSVCQLNYVVYDVLGIERFSTSNWPYIDTGKERVAPLQDHRMSLSKMGLGHLCLPRSLFNRFKYFMVATNTLEQFIVANEDLWDVNVYDKAGKLLRCLTRLEDGLTTEERQRYRLQYVTTDRDDNTYFLIVRSSRDSLPDRSVVYVVDKLEEHCRSLLQESCNIHSIAITDDGKIFGRAVNDGLFVYDTGGNCIHSFELSCYLYDIAATNDDCVMAIDSDNNVHYFTAQEHGLTKIKVKESQSVKRSGIAFHRQSERLVVSTLDNGELHVFIYTQTGDLSGSFIFRGEEGDLITDILSMAITPEGHIAMSVRVKEGKLKFCKKMLVW